MATSTIPAERTRRAQAEQRCAQSAGEDQLLAAGVRHTSRMHYPRLETGRLYLRELTLDDAPAVQVHFGDPEVTELMDIDPCTDLETAREIVAYHLHDTGVRWGVFDRQTHALIGTCGYHCWDEVSAQAEIGYDLSHAHWGRGLMREAGRGRVGVRVRHDGAIGGLRDSGARECSLDPTAGAAGLRVPSRPCRPR